MTVQSDNLVPCRKVVTSNADLRAVLVWLVTSFGKDGPAYQHQQCGKPAYRDVADQELPHPGSKQEQRRHSSGALHRSITAASACRSRRAIIFLAVATAPTRSR